MLVNDHVVILVRIVAEQREIEAVLAVQRPVTASAVAAHLGEDRHDVGIEALRDSGVGPLDQGGSGSGEALVGYPDDSEAWLSSP